MKNRFDLTVPKGMETTPFDYLKEKRNLEELWVYVHRSCILNMTSQGYTFKTTIRNGMRCKEKGITLIAGPVPDWYMLEEWYEEKYDLVQLRFPKQCIGLKMEETKEIF